jgi:uncharacterized protein YheU (UPF0270 family)
VFLTTWLRPGRWSGKGSSQSSLANRGVAQRTDDAKDHRLLRAARGKEKPLIWANSEIFFMAIHIIPAERLSPEALEGIIDEFISRDGTDYGAIEATRETKFRQVKNKLEARAAVLIFDDETETTNIFLADDPLLRRLGE